jgi:hypothetical protein
MDERLRYVKSERINARTRGWRPSQHGLRKSDLLRNRPRKEEEVSPKLSENRLIVLMKGNLALTLNLRVALDLRESGLNSLNDHRELCETWNGSIFQ